MRLVVLWAGIAAFVWIGLHPPMTGLWPWPCGPATYSVDIPTEKHVDIGALLGRWGVVIALTGGLLYTEPRLTLWLRAHRRSIFHITVAIVGAVLLGAVTVFLLSLWGLPK